jgi:hypothetical protein
MLIVLLEKTPPSTCAKNKHMSTKLWHYSEKLTNFITPNLCIHDSFLTDKKQYGRWYRWRATRLRCCRVDDESISIDGAATGRIRSRHVEGSEYKQPHNSATTACQAVNLGVNTHSTQTRCALVIAYLQRTGGRARTTLCTQCPVETRIQIFPSEPLQKSEGHAKHGIPPNHHVFLPRRLLPLLHYPLLPLALSP